MQIHHHHLTAAPPHLPVCITLAEVPIGRPHLDSIDGWGQEVEASQWGAEVSFQLNRFALEE